MRSSPLRRRTANPAVVAPPTQPRNASEFMRRDGQAPARGITQVRQERQESREGNRTFIREGDRTIVREGDRTIIRHNESGRFAIGARNVHVERRGANTETIVERGNGVRIVTVTDSDGRLLRRYRRDAGGREVVIIDNSFAPGAARCRCSCNWPPPIIRIPRERYILDAGRARPDDIYGCSWRRRSSVIDQPYTLDQVRFSAPLRDRMPRVDLDVNFDTGSWQLSPDQVDRLAVDRRRHQPRDQAQPARGVHGRRPHRRGRQRRRQPVAVGPPRRIGRGRAHRAVPGAGREPGDPGLRRAVSQGARRRAPRSSTAVSRCGASRR